MEENIRNTEGPSCPQPEPEENALYMALEPAPAEAEPAAVPEDIPAEKEPEVDRESWPPEAEPVSDPIRIERVPAAEDAPAEVPAVSPAAESATRLPRRAYGFMGNLLLKFIVVSAAGSALLAFLGMLFSLIMLITNAPELPTSFSLSSLVVQLPHIVLAVVCGILFLRNLGHYEKHFATAYIFYLLQAGLLLTNALALELLEDGVIDFFAISITSASWVIGVLYQYHFCAGWARVLSDISCTLAMKWQRVWKFMLITVFLAIGFIVSFIFMCLLILLGDAMVIVTAFCLIICCPLVAWSVYYGIYTLICTIQTIVRLKRFGNQPEELSQ